MAFEPDKITREHVLQAVAKIEAENTKLRASTGYDVMINGQAYPPKEIMRHAHQAMNGDYLWYPGGGEETNRYLKNLGFKITSKKASRLRAKLTGRLYKLGCNWGKGAPSFYSFIHEQKIVLGVEDKRYKVGDLILITEGYRSRAIGKVITDPQLVIDVPSFEKPFSDFSIDYESYVNFSEVEWFDIPEQDQFNYELQAGIRLVGKKEVKDKVFSLWAKKESSDKMNSTNLIIYGPPGTGKTYSTKAYACALARNGNLESVEEWLRGENTHEIWQKLKIEGQIEFVTFHQSFAYEDFVQGLRPVTHSDQLGFKKVDGVFKTISDRARENYEVNTRAKTSVDVPFGAVFNLFIDDLLKDKPKEIEVKMQSSGYSFNLTEYDSDKERISFRKQSGGTGHDLLMHNIRDLYYDRVDLSSHGLRSYYYPVVSALRKQAEHTILNPQEQLRHYVLVIDEINRANISRVLGELITLLEPDKRIGQPNELEVKLPSGEAFSIPPNLHIIGTMNTADKSIAHLDVALRRRFDFKPMYPDIDLAHKAHQPIMKGLNEAILSRYSADFLLGHSYFMTDRPIEEIMEQQVIPLLNEYFNYDTDEIALILEQSGLVVNRTEYDQLSCTGLKVTT